MPLSVKQLVATVKGIGANRVNHPAKGERLHDQSSALSPDTETATFTDKVKSACGNSQKGVGMIKDIGAGGSESGSPGQTHCNSGAPITAALPNTIHHRYRIPSQKQEFGSTCGGGNCGWSCTRGTGGVLLTMVLVVLAASSLNTIGISLTLMTSTRRSPMNDTILGRETEEDFYVGGVRGRLPAEKPLPKIFDDRGAGHEEQPQNKNPAKKDVREPKEPSTVQVCDGYLKKYGIVPEGSWGTAPFKIQEEWKALKCDRVLAEDGFSLDDPPTGGKTRSIVLVWNKITGWLSYQAPGFVKAARETCPTECVFTNDRSVLQQANGVLFHGPTHSKADFPKAKPPGSHYVWVNLEPTTYAPVQNLLRDTHYMSKFDMTMTYERSSDIPLGYVGSNPASYYFNAGKRAFHEKDGFGAPDAIAAFVSNCKAAGAPKRLRYLEELMKHTTVHSFGGCLHNSQNILGNFIGVAIPREEPVLSKANRQENKIAVLTHYKFLLAFENNNELRDYVTEKVYNGFQAGTLPVYWGASNVDDYVPKGSIIKASEFDGPADLAKYLKKLAEDEEAYEAYFKWREDSEEEKRFDEEVVARSAYSVNAMCRLCDRVLEQQQR